jgi:hypothetical protein
MTEFAFLTYNNRSGSTFLSNELNKFDDICVCPEAEILIKKFLDDPGKILTGSAIKGLMTSLLNNVKFSSWKIPEDELRGILRDEGDISINYFFKILTAFKKNYKPGAKLVIFKGTKLLLMMEKLLNVSPGKFKVVHIYRDGRAVYASQKRSIGSLTKKNKPMSNNVVKTAFLWRRFIDLSNSYIKKYPDKFNEVEYENLVRDTETVIPDLIEFFAVENFSLSKNNGSYLEIIPESQKHLHKDINKKADMSKIDNWKNELKNYEIKVFEYMCMDQLRSKNYDLFFDVSDINYADRYLIYPWLRFRHWGVEIRTALMKKLNVL